MNSKNKFYLTKEDKDFLRETGYSDDDFLQIEEAVRRSKYYLIDNQRISYQKAIEILGKNTFLSGISRSAFHWTAERESDEGRLVFFDSSILFK